MKPSEPRRKNRNTTVAASNGSSQGHVVRKRKSPSPAPATSMSELNNQDGPLPEFACKVCGRSVYTCSASESKSVRGTVSHSPVHFV